MCLEPIPLVEMVPKPVLSCSSVPRLIITASSSAWRFKNVIWSSSPFLECLSTMKGCSSNLLYDPQPCRSGPRLAKYTQANKCSVFKASCSLAKHPPCIKHARRGWFLHLRFPLLVDFIVLLRIASCCILYKISFSFSVSNALRIGLK